MNFCLTQAVALIVAELSLQGWTSGALAAERSAAIEKAVSYLSLEVESWRNSKRCFSCHNHGDAARVLFLARSRGFHVEADALASTHEWLSRPRDWVNAAGDTPYKDDKLAAVQFAAALLAGSEANEIRDRHALEAAARLVADFQEPDGQWVMDPGGLGGSPITYGDHLATAICKRLLLSANQASLRPQSELAKAWLLKSESKRTIDLAAVLIGLEGERDAPSANARKRSLQLLSASRQASGGWGPTRFDQQEPFDTGIVLGALSTVRMEPGVTRMIAEAQELLLAQQNEDGSWPETTRPPNGLSYAHRVSTTAWAAWGLLLTGDRQR